MLLIHVAANRVHVPTVAAVDEILVATVGTCVDVTPTVEAVVSARENAVADVTNASPAVAAASPDVPAPRHNLSQWRCAPDATIRLLLEATILLRSLLCNVETNSALRPPGPQAVVSPTRTPAHRK